MLKNLEQPKKIKSDPQTASFFKIASASAVGFIIVIFAVSLISVIILFGVIAAATKKEKVDEKTVLVMNLNNPIVEQQPDNLNFDMDIFGLAGTQPMGLNKILKVIKNAKEDKTICGIFLDLTVVQASLSELKEIKIALEDFKTSGKFIVAHSDTYTQGSYYLATVADKIYLTPTGTLLWKGLSSQVMYYKGLLDKLEVQPEIIRHGKYKSAVEPFLTDQMSEENRIQLETFLKSMWNFYVDEIAKERGLDIISLNLYADSLMINSSEKAVALKFVDAEKFRNDVIDELKVLSGIELDEDLNTISFDKYMLNTNSEIEELAESIDTEDKIAIIYAEGDIIMGKSDDNSMGSITISDAIKKAAKDENVKAIVLRINSPGGSALASEIILHEIELAKKLKPVVVSMGKYAASGGYYIACYAEKIYAEPFTLTGSIGVFGMMFNAENLLKNKLGITVNVVKTNKNADFGNMTRALSPQERQFLTIQIEDIYDDFISHVAKGRNMTKEQVDEIGQGRVWAATDALNNGLIDEIGQIEDAVKYAATLAKIENYNIVEYPKVMNFFDRFLEEMENTALKNHYGVYYDIYEKVQDLQKMSGIQARMIFDVEVY